MLRYVAGRILHAIPVLCGATLIVVFLSHLVPGSPGESFVGEKGTPEKIQELNEALGWNDPILIQWARYVARAVQGDLGRSFVTRRPIGEELAERLPATMELGLTALALACPLGILAGVLSALCRRWPLSLVDHGLSTMALVGISLPVFWLGLLFQVYLYPAQQRLPPLADLTPVTGFFVLDALMLGDLKLVKQTLLHLAIPAMALATIPLAVIARMTRAAMIEVLSCDFIRTARAKGLSPARIAVAHALRNALIPIVTITGMQFGALLGGAVLTESVFQWPGLGTYVVKAAQSKDLPALQGAVLIIASIFVLANLLVDLSYLFLDPRIRANVNAGSKR